MKVGKGPSAALIAIVEAVLLVVLIAGIVGYRMGLTHTMNAPAPAPATAQAPAVPPSGAAPPSPGSVPPSGTGPASPGAVPPTGALTPNAGAPAPTGAPPQVAMAPPVVSRPSRVRPKGNMSVQEIPYQVPEEAAPGPAEPKRESRRAARRERKRTDEEAAPLEDRTATGRTGLEENAPDERASRQDRESERPNRRERRHRRDERDTRMARDQRDKLDKRDQRDQDNTAQTTPEARTASGDEDTGASGPEAVVQRYAQTLNAGDVRSHMSLYAPRVDRWFRKGNVPKSEIRRYKEREWAQSPSRIRIRDMRTRKLGPDRVEVTFDKQWDTRGRKRWQGELIGTMEMRKVGNTWKIVSERDRRVLWERRSSDRGQEAGDRGQR